MGEIANCIFHPKIEGKKNTQKIGARRVFEDGRHIRYITGRLFEEGKPRR